MTRRLIGSKFVVTINKEHIALVIKVRRALCIGEGWRVA